MWLPHRAACFPGGPGFRREFLSADYPACLAGHAGHVYLGVGIHATGDERPGICDRSHVLSTSLGRTGMAPPGRDERTEHFRDNRGQAPTRSRSPRPARVTRPSTPGRQFGFRTRSRGQQRPEPGRGPAAGHAKPHRNSSWIAAGHSAEHPICNLTHTILRKCNARRRRVTGRRGAAGSALCRRPHPCRQGLAWSGGLPPLVGQQQPGAAGVGVPPVHEPVASGRAAGGVPPSGQFGEVVGELVVSGEGHCAVAVHPSCAGAGVDTPGMDEPAPFAASAVLAGRNRLAAISVDVELGP
jgi:hypothetical protein